ncbi:hypothetical protein CsSME_00029493 [Camellia sinensis var. sinensis]
MPCKLALNLIRFHFVYSFANAPGSARMDWSAFTKGYFLNRETLVAVLLLIDASIPMTFVFTKCDKMKGKGKRPDENIKNFQDSNTSLGRDELLLHMSQLRNFWDN